MSEKQLKMKVCLVGDGAVGKTSLVRRFVLNEFDERYLYTLGTNVFKKEVLIVSGSRRTKVTMMVWDIAGQKDLRRFFVKSYFRGADGGIAVCDVTREHTLEDLSDWIRHMHEVCGPIPVTILANKVDLKEERVLKEGRLSGFARKHSAPYFFTSAKTGKDVEKAFAKTAERIARRLT